MPRRRSSGCDSCEAIKVTVDNYQFVVVMLVWVSAQRTTCICSRIREVVHACIQRAAISRLVIEAESVTDLLTDHVKFLVGIVVEGCIEVRVVHLGGALGDVRPTGDINRGQAKPP